jgi:hypothetical protein
VCSFEYLDEAIELEKEHGVELITIDNMRILPSLKKLADNMEESLQHAMATAKKHNFGMWIGFALECGGRGQVGDCGLGMEAVGYSSA